MDKGERLRKSSQFAEVYRKGRTWAGEFLVLKALPNKLEQNRYGYVTGKRVGNAVTRNRVKRLLREAVRSSPVKRGWDIVLIARKCTAEADYYEIGGAVRELLRRARILEEGRSGIEQERS
ncbi:MAG: ribonuclease P protein component [Dehalococcoidia bacterium]|nr:ribonuclease P protein component [Dehalococcoidia bacterium]